MRAPGCKASPPCELVPVPLERVQLRWDGKAAGRKACAFPSESTVYLETAFWDSIPTVEGRLGILGHEVGHLAGANCEPCADFYAGRFLRENGVATPRDARRVMRARLDNRDPVEASDNVARGFGVDDPPLLELPKDPTQGLPTRTDEGWRNGKSIGALKLVNADPEHGECWLAEPVARAWRMVLLDPETVAKRCAPSRYASSFRTYQKQAELRRLYESGAIDPKTNPPRPYALAAKPGFSNHQDGEAVDPEFATGTAREAFAAIAQKHGFVRDVPGEAWHFHYVGPVRAALQRAAVPGLFAFAGALLVGALAVFA